MVWFWPKDYEIIEYFYNMWQISEKIISVVLPSLIVLATIYSSARLFLDWHNKYKQLITLSLLFLSISIVSNFSAIQLSLSNFIGNYPIISIIFFVIGIFYFIKAERLRHKKHLQKK